MSDTNATLAQEFYNNFQTRRHEFSLRLKDAKADEVDALSLELAQSRKQLVDATPFLPSYDQGRYETQLKEWEESLDELRASTTRSKFAFKRKEGTPRATNSTAPKKLAVTNEIQAPSTYLTLSSHSNSRLSFSSLPNSRDQPESDVTIADLDKCIVDLVGISDVEARPRLTALHIRNITDTVLLLPVIKGSVLLHNLNRCVVVVGCHQFRMHTSTNVDVYLSIPSNPVIEHCSAIRFAQYPSSLLGASSSDVPNGPLSVQDFSHIRATPSPNWTTLSDSDTVENWVMAQASQESESLVDTLNKFLPLKHM